MAGAPLGGEWGGESPTGRGEPGAKRSPPAGATPEGVPAGRPEPAEGAPRGLRLDEGWGRDDTRALVEESGSAARARARGEEAEARKREAGPEARRRVVERTRGRTNRSRRILIRGGREVANCFGVPRFVCARITCRSAGRLG